MTEAETQLRTSLQAHKLSVTTARQTIFRALLARKQVTMAELAAACPQVDRASVYRTVELFEKLNICRRVQFGWKYTIELSDAFQAHHHHMYCTKCGATIELPEDPTLEKRLHDLAAAHTFTITDHQIELRGRCAKCSAKPL